MEFIELTQGKKTIVDDDMFQFLNSFKWHVMSRHGFSYAYKQITIGKRKQQFVAMHHCVVGFPLHGKVVDHINGDTLDNRSQNLRVVSNRDNLLNRKSLRNGTKSSKYSGVYKDRETGKWRAEIRVKGKRIFLGRHVVEEKASEAYENARRKLLPE